MRIHSVTLAGFGPFRDEVTVDFDQFSDDGIFVLTGRTGAGKSSILDAVTYGLFGTVPRYDTKVDDRIRSTHLEPGEPTEVTVEFSIDQRHYRVWRSPSFARPKQRGDGFTQQAARIELSRIDASGEVTEVLETRVANADRHVQELLGLSAAQFGQVVLLAQGQFAEFLVASSETRRKLLRTLFRTQRFDEYAGEVNRRAKLANDELKNELSRIDAKAEMLAAQWPDSPEIPDDHGSQLIAWTAQIVDFHRVAHADAARGAEVAQTAAERAEIALAEARSVLERQERLHAAQHRRASLEAERQQIDELRRRITAAGHAALAHQSVLAHARALEQMRGAHDRHESASKDFNERLGQPPADLRALIDDISATIGALEKPAEHETQLPTLRQRADAAADAHATLRRATEQRHTEAADIRQRMAKTDQQLHEADDLGARRAGAAAELTALRTRLSQATRAATQLSSELTQAKHDRLHASKRAHQLDSELISLRQRQLDEWAGKMAAQLTDDEPCPVCGSTEHPSPTPISSDPVSDDAIAQAEATLAEARDVEAELAGREGVISSQLETARAAADGTPEELTPLIERTEATLDDLSEQIAQRELLQKARRDDAERLQILDDLLATADQAQQEAAESAATSAAAADAAERSVAEALGQAASVAERRAGLREDRKLAQDLLSAATDVATCAAQLAEAESALSLTLSAEGFDSADAVREAAMAPQEMELLTSRVADHDRAVATVGEVLADPQMAELPDEPVDLLQPTAEHDAARQAAREATATLATASDRLGLCEGLAHDIATAVNDSNERLERYQQVSELDLLLRGLGGNRLTMPLETFALVAELDDILGAANVQLAAMTAGRYELCHDDSAASRGTAGLGLSVLDAHTGSTRSPASLSGGEKFQAALALALALAEVVTARAGGIRLDTLFIDEGFGSLDPETLEVTMATLDALREGGRTIGLISHVEAMQEQIPAQLAIDVTAGGWSTITPRE